MIWPQISHLERSYLNFLSPSNYFKVLVYSCKTNYTVYPKVHGYLIPCLNIPNPRSLTWSWSILLLFKAPPVKWEDPPINFGAWLVGFLLIHRIRAISRVRLWCWMRRWCAISKVVNGVAVRALCRLFVLVMLVQDE